MRVNATFQLILVCSSTFSIQVGRKLPMSYHPQCQGPWTSCSNHVLTIVMAPTDIPCMNCYGVQQCRLYGLFLLAFHFEMALSFPGVRSQNSGTRHFNQTSIQLLGDTYIYISCICATCDKKLKNREQLRIN